MQPGANAIHQRAGPIAHFTHGGNLLSDTQEIRDRPLQGQRLPLVPAVFYVKMTANQYVGWLIIGPSSALLSWICTFPAVQVEAS